MTDQPMLPKQFADLEPFARVWALPSGGERYARRLASSMDELEDFYDAIFPRAEEIMSYLDRFELDDLPDDALNLLRLMYALSTVSASVDIFKQQKVPESGKTYLAWIDEPVP